MKRGKNEISERWRARGRRAARRQCPPHPPRILWCLWRSVAYVTSLVPLDKRLKRGRTSQHVRPRFNLLSAARKESPSPFAGPGKKESPRPLGHFRLESELSLDCGSGGRQGRRRAWSVSPMRDAAPPGLDIA